METKPLPYVPWFHRSLPALFETLSAKQIAEQFVALANHGDPVATSWIEKLLSEGRAATVNEVAAAPAQLELAIVPVVRGTHIGWEYAYKQHDRPADLYAWALIRILQNGMDSRIRRCRLKDCRKLFFGDVRARWCSKGCGSKFRVRKKRRNDRE